MSQNYVRFTAANADDLKATLAAFKGAGEAKIAGAVKPDGHKQNVYVASVSGKPSEAQLKLTL